MENLPIDKFQITDMDKTVLSALQRVDFLSDKIVLFDSFKSVGLSQYVNLKGVVLLLVDKGSCELEVNLNKVEISEGGVYMCFPGQVARMMSMSEDFKPLCIGCSRNMTEEMMTFVEDGFRMFMVARQVVGAKWNAEKFEFLKQSFYGLQSKMQNAKDNKFYYQIVKHSLMTLFFECFGYMMEHVDVNAASSRKESLFRAFINSVEKNHRKEHSVKFYADELSITPKYLSAVTDDLTGKCAKQWIDEYVAMTAKLLLKSTKQDIQEISEMLNFPDMSFFGKFFKRMVGLSPKAYRNKRE